MKSKIVLFVFIALLATVSVFKGEILSNLSIGFSYRLEICLDKLRAVSRL